MAQKTSMKALNRKHNLFLLIAYILIFPIMPIIDFEFIDFYSMQELEKIILIK